MMLYKLSLANIKKSFKDYAIYFITLILGICIFYVFNSMDSQTAMLEVNSRKGEMIDLLIEILSYVSVFVSFILGFLIIYASRFLMKKRNKEFAIYLTLGMSKRKISMLLLIETFIIGLISLVVGLILGIVISQITSIFVANMFEADMTRFSFNFSKAAVIKTIFYFSIIYFIIMIFNTIIINKNKLINLLQASKRGENVKIKNPYICIVLFVASILLLGFAYYLVTNGIHKLMEYEISILLVPISLGIIGTVLFFYSVAGMILKLVSKWHSYYYKDLNSFVYKQISSKINTMVISISIICLMLFVTLCLLSVSFTIKNFFNDSIKKYAPVDFAIFEYDLDDDSKLIENDSYFLENVNDLVIVYNYRDEEFTYGKSLGEYEMEVRDKYPHIIFDSLVFIMSESDYNKMANIYHLDTMQLENDQYAIVSNYEIDIYQETLNRNSIMNIFGKNLKPYPKVIEGFQSIGGNPMNTGFFVVKDEIIGSETEAINQIVIGNYNTEDETIIKSLEEKIQDYKNNTYIYGDTKIEIKENAAGLKAIVTFIGLYLGIIFLISSSAILALKELSDCLDDKNKYKVLRQIGVEEKDIDKSLFKQTIIFFMMPLSLAIIHTIFGLEFCKWVLASLGINSILDGSIMTFVFLVVIYGIYFIITYLCGKNIIKERV